MCLFTLGRQRASCPKEIRGVWEQPQTDVEMSICDKFITIAPGINIEDDTPLKGWACVLRGECYQVEQKVKGGPLFFFFFFQFAVVFVYLLQQGKFHYLALAV